MAAFTLLYGIASYAVFLCTFLYAIGFIGNLWVPKSVDVGVPAGAAGEPLALSVLVNVLLHSVMARPAFKRWWTRFVPRPVERSTYVLLASLSLLLLFAQWRPLTGQAWQMPEGPAAGTVLALQATGWLLVLASTFLIDHFELFGVKQVLARLTGLPLPAPVFRTPMLYKHVRHPIYLGFMLAFWSAPTMTVGHLLFAVATTGYILIGIWFEERDLVQLFGQRYTDYRQRVGMLLPLRRRYEDAAHTASATGTAAAAQRTPPARHQAGEGQA
jgi:methanethiol S-methyltransferase